MTSGPEIRLRTEERERACLSPYAIKSRFSKGRLRPEEPCLIRTHFQRDRDRIIHCKAFRRLKHKTQVFIAPLGDHYVTRLTHTLEVTQIARTISRALDLNEDLTEAIGLGHDLGHTPFGHIGEEVLNKLYQPGFRHNEQSLRVVDRLENEGRGLNLTWEVREGILKHSKSMKQVLGADWGKAGTFEAQVVKISDLVAYINHDIEDAIRAGVISPGDLPAYAVEILGSSHRRRVNSMVSDIIITSRAASGQTDEKRPEITMSRDVVEAADQLRQYLFTNVYDIQSSNQETDRARRIVTALFEYLRESPEHLPADYRSFEKDIERAAVDYIAGMTDQYAISLTCQFGIKI
jgi:dGTPase